MLKKHCLSHDSRLEDNAHTYMETTNKSTSEDRPATKTNITNRAIPKTTDMEEVIPANAAPKEGSKTILSDLIRPEATTINVVACIIGQTYMTSIAWKNKTKTLS